MNVFFNVEAIAHPLTGVGNYAYQLAQRLRSHAQVASLICFTHFGVVSTDRIGSPQQGQGRRRRIPKPLRSLLRRLPFAYELRDQACAYALRRLRKGLEDCVYHEPNYVIVPFDGPTVVSVHDLSHLHYPLFHPRERVAHLAKGLSRSLERASRVIVDSEFVRRELIEHMGVRPEKVRTVHCGVDAVFRPRSREETLPVLQRYGLCGSDYVLSVTTLEPRKNLVSLLTAFSRLPERLQRAHPLVLVGAKGWHTEEIENAMTPLLQLGLVRWIGYVPAEELPVLYSGAFAFAFPSLYEGFGLPPLEAMASGVPVLTSNVSAMPEVTGGAALLVDPRDLDNLTEGLTRLITDEEFRQRARADGLARARLFTWEGSVEGIIQVYRSALGLKEMGAPTSPLPT